MFFNLKTKPFFRALTASMIIHVGVVVFFISTVKVTSESTNEQYEIIPINQFSDQMQLTKSNQIFKKKSENQVNTNSLNSNKEQSQASQLSNSSAANRAQSLGTETESISQIEPPKIQNKVTFNRTNQARLAHFEGDSKLKIKINKTGEVINVGLLNSLPYGLDERSLEIVNSLKMTPALLDGAPIDYEFIFTIRYRNE